MRSILISTARLQCAAMFRAQLVWTAGLALAWNLIVAFQEPTFAQRFDVPFVEPSVRVGAVAIGLLIGAVAAEVDQPSWTGLRDRSRRPATAVLGIWLGGLGFSSVVALVYMACFALSSLVAGGQMTSSADSMRSGAVLVLVAANSLALAPAVASCCPSLAFRSVVWTLLVASSSGAFGFSAPIPIPILWTNTTFLDVQAVVPLASALIASLSLAVITFRRKTPALSWDDLS